MPQDGNPPVNIWQFCILRASHQAELQLELGDNLSDEDFEKALRMLSWGEHVIARLYKKPL